MDPLSLESLLEISLVMVKEMLHKKHKSSMKNTETHDRNITH